VQRRLHALGHDAVRLQRLRVVDLRAGVADPPRRVHVPGMREIDELHGEAPSGRVMGTSRASIVRRLQPSFKLARSGRGPRQDSRTMEKRNVTRRDLFRVAAAGAVTATVGLQLGEGGPRAAAADDTSTPDGALQALVNGNARFLARTPTSFTEDRNL